MYFFFEKNKSFYSVKKYFVSLNKLIVMKKVYSLLALGIVFLGYAQATPKTPELKNNLDASKFNFKPIPKLESVSKPKLVDSFNKKPNDSQLYASLKAPKRNDDLFTIPNLQKPVAKAPVTDDLLKQVEKK